MIVISVGLRAVSLSWGGRPTEYDLLLMFDFFQAQSF